MNFGSAGFLLWTSRVSLVAIVLSGQSHFNAVFRTAMTAPTAIVGFVNDLGQHRVLRGIRAKRIWQIEKASPMLDLYH